MLNNKGPTIDPSGAPKKKILSMSYSDNLFEFVVFCCSVSQILKARLKFLIHMCLTLQLITRVKDSQKLSKGQLAKHQIIDLGLNIASIFILI